MSAVIGQPWDVQLAVNSVLASGPEDCPDELLIDLLRTAMDQPVIDALFGELHRRYGKRVENWCLRVTKDRDRASDLAQEVFLKAFRNLHSYRGDAQLSTWLYVITRNHCLNSVKRWRTEPTDAAAEIRPDLSVTNGLETHVALERAQACQDMYRTVSSILTPLEMRIMVLHYAHDLPLASITRHLMLANRSGAKAYIVSARRRLKAWLQSSATEEPMTPACPLAA